MLDKVVTPAPPLHYCVTREEAEVGFLETVQAANGWPIGLDIETAAGAAETERLRALVLQQADLKGRLKAARKVKAPETEIAALTAEAKILIAQIKYAKAAGLDPHRSRIRLVQLAVENRVIVIDVFRVGEEILHLLDGVNVVLHNAAFEISHLEHAGIELGEVQCTMQAARLTLDEHAMSLADAALAYLDIELDKTEQQSDWSAPNLTLAQLEYAAHDAVMAFNLSRRILPALGAQVGAYEIQITAVPAAARMQRRGIRLDRDAHAGFIEAKRAQRVETCAAYKAACVDMGLLDLAAKLPAKPSEKQAVLEAILSSDEIASWKRTEKSGALSTARNELKRVAFLYPPIRELVALSKIDKILSAFGPTLTTMVSPVTGRIHANYRIAATASGRATCSYPNLQQAPRDPDFRALFRAAEGRKLVGGDFSGMELRAMAAISGDRAMTEAFRAGKDLHKITASRMLGKPEDAITKEDRQAAKAVNFGSIFGIGASGLVKTAWDQYDVVLTLEEAHRWVDAVDRAYPTLRPWRYDHYRKCQADGKIVIGKDAKRGIGRFYPLSRLPKGAHNGYTRACNFPVQGSCADVSMLALEAIDRLLFEHEIDGGPVAWLHDEIILEVPETNAEQARELLEKAMVDAFAETFPGAPLNGLVDVRIGDNWAEVKG
jgi:DNA polymerase I